MTAPPSTSSGNSAALSPTHQLTVRWKAMPISAAPNAAGLNRWRLPLAMMYFEAIGQADTRTRNPVAARSPGEAGVTISAMINALMQTDSQLLFAWKTRAKAQLTPKHASSATTVEKAKFTGGWCTTPRTDKAN